MKTILPRKGNIQFKVSQISSGRIRTGMQYLGLPRWVSSKESACNKGDADLIPGWGRSPGGGRGKQLHYSGLGESHGQRRSLTWLQSIGLQRVRHDWINTYTCSIYPAGFNWWCTWIGSHEMCSHGMLCIFESRSGLLLFICLLSFFWYPNIMTW